MAFCPEHPKWDQNPRFTPLSETTSIPTTFICGVPPPGDYNVLHLYSALIKLLSLSKSIDQSFNWINLLFKSITQSISSRSLQVCWAFPRSFNLSITDIRSKTRIELLCIGFHYVESVYFCWTKHFNFLLNNHNNLFSFELFGKLFHIIAPLYLTATWCLFCPCDNVFVGGTGMQAIWLLKTGQNL